jgi:hypothetical protein
MLAQTPPAWAIRPWPHDKYRLREFLAQGIAAIGWPRLGDLSSCDRSQIKERLHREYYGSANSMSLGQATGIVHRFVRIKPGDAVAIPDGDRVYFGVVTSPYAFKSELQSDAQGYPHQIGVKYELQGKALLRLELPARLFDSFKGRQSVFELPAADVWDVLRKPERYVPVDPGAAQEVRDTYVTDLARGAIPGINSPRFEQAVQKVLSFYFPGLRRLMTTDSPVGGDTDLRTELPGGVVIRIQVKCFQEHSGPLGPGAVEQLRASMEPGERGVVVTTNTVAQEAVTSAESNSEKPIGIISGTDFAELVFENLGRLTDADLWTLGLRRQLTSR